MAKNYALTKIRRSRLIMPVLQRKFVEKAHTRNADTVVLDLEDSIPDRDKLLARERIEESIPVVRRGGCDLLVRVNNTPELLRGDIEAAVRPGIDGIVLPKSETAEEIAEVARFISRLEQERGIAPQRFTISCLIESARGFLNMEQIGGASERIDSFTLGNEDFATEISLRVGPETFAGMLPFRMHLLLVARCHGKIPMGLVGSMTAFTDTGGFEALAALSYQHGFLGSSCIHPDNVEALNTCFSPKPDEVEDARGMMEALDQAYAEGKAAITWKGRMVDIANYKRARILLDRAEAIQALEAKKRRAREAA